MEPSFMEYSLSTQELESVNFFKRLYFDRIGFFEYAVSHRASRIAPEFFIVFLCVRGKGWLELNGKRHAVSPGDVFSVSPALPTFTARMTMTLGRFTGRIFIPTSRILSN